MLIISFFFSRAVCSNEHIQNHILAFMAPEWIEEFEINDGAGIHTCQAKMLSAYYEALVYIYSLLFVSFSIIEYSILYNLLHMYLITQLYGIMIIQLVLL